MVDISNTNINNTMNKLDKTTLFFLTNKTYLNKINNNNILNNDNDNDIKTDFIKYKKPIKTIINKLFEEYTNIETEITNKEKSETKKKYEHAFYIFSKLCIQHIKSEELNKKINYDLSSCSNENNFNLHNNSNNNSNDNSNDNSNNNLNENSNDNSNNNLNDYLNNDKLLFNAFNSNSKKNNIKKFIDIKPINPKKKILPRRIE